MKPVIYCQACGEVVHVGVWCSECQTGLCSLCDIAWASYGHRDHYPIPVARVQRYFYVANFSSPHPFHFSSGETLPACDPKRVEAASLKRVSTEQANPRIHYAKDHLISFEITREVERLVGDAMNDAHNGVYDVVIIPFAMRDPLLRYLGRETLSDTPFRTIYTVNRETKLIAPDQWGI